MQGYSLSGRNCGNNSVALSTSSCRLNIKKIKALLLYYSLTPVSILLDPTHYHKMRSNNICTNN